MTAVALPSPRPRPRRHVQRRRAGAGILLLTGGGTGSRSRHGPGRFRPARRAEAAGIVLLHRGGDFSHRQGRRAAVAVAAARAVAREGMGRHDPLEGPVRAVAASCRCRRFRRCCLAFAATAATAAAGAGARTAASPQRCELQHCWEAIRWRREGRVLGISYLPRINMPNKNKQHILCGLRRTDRSAHFSITITILRFISVFRPSMAPWASPFLLTAFE